jgi:hypothetical protein
VCQSPIQRQTFFVEICGNPRGRASVLLLVQAAQRYEEVFGGGREGIAGV